MNKVTTDIMKLLNISVEDALNIQRQMDTDGFDFSESTQAEFNRAVRNAYRLGTCEHGFIRASCGECK